MPPEHFDELNQEHQDNGGQNTRKASRSFGQCPRSLKS